MDGEIAAAAQEERFTRKKNDASYPENAIKFALEETGLCLGEVDYVAFYDKPILKFERLLETASDRERRGDRTALVIAHRQETIDKCDAILRFDDGRLVETVTNT